VEILTTAGSSSLLVDQIAVIDELEPKVIEPWREEYSSRQILWVREYSEYGSGDCLTKSLVNELGDATDVTIRDCSAVPTNLLEELPYTARMLEGLGLDIMWARLARLTANSFL
jgi:hypothetical protein